MMNNKNKEIKNDEIIFIRKNKYYDSAKPLVSLYTPNYNGRDTIQRTFDSVKNQVFKNFEYIIIDDGSTDGVEKIINKFMDNVDIPVIFIKKKNGGLHTVRNLGVKYARGKYCTCVDSDDELLPEALSTCVAAWDSIPKNKVHRYREVVALCEDENHNIVGSYFPDNINSVDMKTARKLCRATKGEHFGMDITKVRKENLLPEPKGVKYVVEDIVWRKLDLEYDSYYINKVLRVYHLEGENRMSKNKNKNIQNVINMLYNSHYYLNNDKLYIDSFKQKIVIIIRYQVAKNIVNRAKIKVEFDNTIKHIKNKFLICILYIPCFFYTYIYINKNKPIREILKHKKD